MNTRFKENVQKLFEYWCEISPTAIGEKVSGVIVESFPDKYKDTEIISKIPEFAYPCQFLNESVQTYSFVLTSSDSKWRFGFCRHDAKTQKAMVLITYLPWHDTFLKFLNVLGELRRTSKEEFQPFLAEAYSKGVPEPGACLKLFYNSGLSNFDFQRPSQFQLPSIPQNHNLNVYYNFVDPKNMIAVFAAMLAERRMIFTSQRLDRLSSCVQAANAFLYPMVWQHIFIPILPLKMKDILCAPMPYLIGVPEAVLETMTREELGDVVILNCDNKYMEAPNDDVKNMPPKLVKQLKKQLSNQHEHLGDRVSKIFLNVLVQLIGCYRDGIKFSQGEKNKWCREQFIASRPPHLQPFLQSMSELQIFQQFIEERMEMLNTGLGFSDEFELETWRHIEKSSRRGKNFLRNVKDKTNPAVKSAVQSVKQGGSGVKTAFKDIKSKLSDRTQSKVVTRLPSTASATTGGYQHHSAPNSPLKPVNSVEYTRRSSRSGSLVSTPDHQPKNASVPVGTLFLLDDLIEPSMNDSETKDISASNSLSNFDTPPDTLPPIPPRLSNPPRNSRKEQLVIFDEDDSNAAPPIPVARSKPKSHQAASASMSPIISSPQSFAQCRMLFENNFVQNNTNTFNAMQKSVTPPLIEPPTLNSTMKSIDDVNSSENSSNASANLIELDASTSFELDDFDPLNQNAKKMPPIVKPTPAQIVLPQIYPPTSAGASQTAFSNPVYPFFMPQANHNQQRPSMYVSSAPKQDDDVELLRKYGLDRFKLVDTNNRQSLTDPILISNGNANQHLTSNTCVKTNGDFMNQNQQRKNAQWTTFD